MESPMADQYHDLKPYTTFESVIGSVVFHAPKDILFYVNPDRIRETYLKYGTNLLAISMLLKGLKDTMCGTGRFVLTPKNFYTEEDLFEQGVKITKIRKEIRPIKPKVLMRQAMFELHKEPEPKEEVTEISPLEEVMACINYATEEIVPVKIEEPEVATTTTVQQDNTAVEELKANAVMIGQQNNVFVSDGFKIVTYKKAPKKEQKVELTVRKQRKVPQKFTAPKIDLNTITNEMKVKWLHEGIYNSRTERAQKIWDMRPQERDLNKAEAEWSFAYRKVKPELNDILFFHFHPMFERKEGIPQYNREHLPPVNYEFKSRQVSYEDLWLEQLESHYRDNNHHPEHWNSQKMSWSATLECIADLWACGMRSKLTYKEAWEEIFSWLATEDRAIPSIRPKFAVLDPVAMLFFYTQLVENGINSKQFAMPSRIMKLRNTPLSTRALEFNWEKSPRFSDWKKIKNMPEFRNYISDLTLHIQMVENISSSFLPYKTEHDKSKMNVCSLMAYVYRWHVKDKLPKEVEFTAGEECPNCANPFCKNREVGGTCTNEDGFFSRMTEHLKGFAKSSYNTFKGKLQEVLPDSLIDLATKLKEQLKELGEVAKGLMKKITSILKPIMDYIGLNHKFDCITAALDIVRYYVIWINTPSPAIHAICIYAIASTLGITDILIDTVTKFFASENPEVVESVVDSEEESSDESSESEPESEATSDDGVVSKIISIFESLFSINPTTVAIPLSFFILLFFGIRLKGKAITSLGNDFVNSMKNFHYVGAGLLGITKIFNVFFDSIKFVFEWCAKKFFNKMPSDEKEKEELEKKIKRYISWATQVNILAADENAPKMISDRNIQKKIKDIFNEGIEIYHMYLRKELPDKCSFDFPRVWDRCRMLHNVLLRAMCTQDFRVTPFHLQLYGDAGIGKSTLIKSIVKSIGSKYYPDDDHLTYSQPPTEQCDGYNGQPIWLADDAQAVNDWKMILQFILFISNCPIMLMMSNLEAKGTMFTSSWVISTTNNPYVHINGLYNQTAWKRRRHYLIKVTTDKNVIDPTDHKFSLPRFRKHYPDSDPSSYPHLKFTLMDPLENRPIDKQELPSGVTVPVTDMTYEKMLANMFGRYEQHTAAEKDYKSSTDKKIQLLKEQLAQFDTAYEDIKDRNDIWKGIFQNNFEDPNKTNPVGKSTEEHPENLKTPPKEPEPEVSGQQPSDEYDDNYDDPEGESSDDDYFDPEAILLEQLKSPKHFELLKDSIERALDRLHNQFNEDYEAEEEVLNMILEFVSLFHVWKGLGTIEKCEDKTRIVTKLNRLKNRIFNLQVFDDLSKERPRLMSRKDTYVALIQEAERINFYPKTLHFYQFMLDVCDCLKIAKSDYLIKQIVEGTANTVLHTRIPQTFIDEFPLPKGRERCRAKIRELENDLISLNERISEWMDSNFGDPIQLTYFEGKKSPTELFNMVKTKISQDVGNYADFCTEQPKNKYSIIAVLFWRLVVNQGLTTKIEAELRRKLQYEKFKKKRGEFYDEESEDEDGKETNANAKDRRTEDEKAFDAGAPPPQSYEPLRKFFGEDVTDDGVELLDNLKFGIRVSDRIASYTWWIHAEDLPSPNFSDLLTFHRGDFYLFENEWSKLYPYNNPAYTDGNIQMSWLFMSGLSRKEVNGENKWFWKTKENRWMEHDINQGHIIIHTTTYTMTGTSSKFIESYKKWIQLTPEQRDVLYGIWLKHRAVINYFKTTAVKVKNTFTKYYRKFMGMMTGSISYVWNFVKRFKVPIGIVVTASAIITACTWFSRLFIPESTSFRASSIFARSSGKSHYTNNLIAKRLLDGVARCNIEGSSFQGFKIYGKCLLVPLHAVKHVLSQKKRKFWMSVDIAENVKHGYMITYLNVTPVLGADSAIIYSENLPDWGNRLKYIKTAGDIETEKQDTAAIIYKNVDGLIEIGETPYEGMERSQTVNLDGKSIDIKQLGVLDCFVNVGVSGCPIVVQNHDQNAYNILGFQSFRRANKSYFSIVSRETLEKIIKQFDIVQHEGPLIVDLDNSPAESTSEILEPHMELIGSVPPEYRCSQTPCTEFQKTILYPFFPEERVPAVLSAGAPEACGDPAKHSINKHGRDSMKMFDQDLMDQAVREYSEYYRSQINKPRVLNVFEACEGDGTMRHIDLNSSPGLPWVLRRTEPGKKSFLKIDEQGKLEFIHPDLVKSIQNFEEHFKNRKIPSFSMMEIMKDELRPISKAFGLTEEQVHILYGKVNPALWPPNRNCKTRTITVMPMEYTIIYRKYFANFFTQLYKLSNKGTEAYCVGINAESPAALHSFMRAQSLNTQGFDLDVSNWDGHCSPQMFLAATKLINSLYDDNDSNQNLRKTLIESVLTGYVQYKDMVYRKQWGNPSGFPGTADINTLSHALIGYVSWLDLQRKAGNHHLCRLDKYQEHILDLYYGDDRLVIPSKEVENVYNGDSVAKWYTEHGWPTTSAAKDSGVSGLMPLSSLQFLKRKWRVEPNDPTYVHWAMDKSTINTLCTYVRKTHEPRQQFDENIRTALDFAADWGENYFNYLKDLINRGLMKKRRRPVIMDYHATLGIKRARYFGPINSLEHEEDIFSKIEIKECVLEDLVPDIPTKQYGMEEE